MNAFGKAASVWSVACRVTTRIAAIPRSESNSGKRRAWTFMGPRPSVPAGPGRAGSAEAAADQRAQHPEAVRRGQLLALVAHARPVLDRHLEDPLAAAQQPGGDLGL